MEIYDKLKIRLEGFLAGRKYYKALTAMQYAKPFHGGKRKDNITPEFQHQLEIALFITNLTIDEPENTIALSFLHDSCEDADLDIDEVGNKFGIEIKTPLWLVTKKYKGTKKSTEEYYDSISRDKVASILKGVDRINNVNSMVGVFSIEKQKEYIIETEKFVLPMIKKAQDLFPSQDGAYETIKYVLKSQMKLIQAIHESK